MAYERTNINKTQQNHMNIEPVNMMGMEVDLCIFESCTAIVGTGDDWATIYSMESAARGKGHGTQLLTDMKKHYESQGKKFGSSVALSEVMARLLVKLNIPEYE